MNNTTTDYMNNKLSNSRQINNITFSSKNSLSSYVINEFKNILQLFQNLMYNFDKCEERKMLFIQNINNNTNKDDKKNFLVLLYNIFYIKK